ncbi:MAG: hypothetical protein J6I52_10605 [Prevotella sp.]|nr:hypothetical protein [Prevotella sp.]
MTTKYNKEDSLDTLESIDDAATCNWGVEWRTPTVDEWRELLENCDWYISDGIYGISKINGHTIVLSKSTGCRDDYSYHTQKDNGCYWTANNSLLDKHRAYSVQCSYYCYITPNINRYWGMAIRPVLDGCTAGIANDLKKPTSKEKSRVCFVDGKLKIIHEGTIYKLNGCPENEKLLPY